MKLKNKKNFFTGIRFSVWLAFFGFAVGIVGVLWILQFSFFKPYYRNMQVRNVTNLVEQIQYYLTSQQYVTSVNIDKALETTVNNNACAIIYNDNGQVVYSADGIGSSCIFNNVITINDIVLSPKVKNDGKVLVDLLKENDGQISVVLSNSDTNQETIFYGEIVSRKYSNFYVFVNSPVEPNDSIMAFFQSSFFIYTIIVMVLSVIVAFILSRMLSKPFISMTKSAEKLALGDYDTHFNGGYFNESKELADTLNYATDKLSKVDELRKDLIANVSHDIKTPLTMISAYAEMIRDISGDNKEKRNDHLEVILKESAFLNRLVTDMSELSKMQSGNYELTISEFDIVESALDMVDLCQMLLDKEKIKVSVSGLDKYMVKADEIKIGQVIYNFLTNAIKHSNADSTIEINIDKYNKDCVKVSVSDHGEGIAKDKLDLVWDRYYKIDKSFSRHSMESTGLGLSIVKAILDCHHALYGVDSIQGEGSTFWFILNKDSETIK